MIKGCVLTWFCMGDTSLRRAGLPTTLESPWFDDIPLCPFCVLLMLVTKLPLVFGYIYWGERCFCWRESKRCHWWSKATATQSIAASEATIAVETASMNELDECSTTNGITASIVPPSDYYPNKAPAELSSSVKKETRKIQIVCVFFYYSETF